MSRSGTQPAVAGNHGSADCFGKRDVHGIVSCNVGAEFPGEIQKVRVGDDG
jgi:hypothetical protein